MYIEFPNIFSQCIASVKEIEAKYSLEISHDYLERSYTPKNSFFFFFIFRNSNYLEISKCLKLYEEIMKKWLNFFADLFSWGLFIRGFFSRGPFFGDLFFRDFFFLYSRRLHTRWANDRCVTIWTSNTFLKTNFLKRWTSFIDNC